MDSKIFTEELQKIEDREFRKLIAAFIEQAPDYVGTVPASSTGKHHPSFDNGEGGLVRHLKMCVCVAEELMGLEAYEGVEKDSVIAACLLHDMYKNGYTDSGRTVYTHADICYHEFSRFAEQWVEKSKKYHSKKTIQKLEGFVRYTADGIRWHMGQWGCEPRSTLYGRTGVVQLADYISSRKFFDKYRQSTDEQIAGKLVEAFASLS